MDANTKRATIELVAVILAILALPIAVVLDVAKYYK